MMQTPPGYHQEDDIAKDHDRQTLTASATTTTTHTARRRTPRTNTAELVPPESQDKAPPPRKARLLRGRKETPVDNEDEPQIQETVPAPANTVPKTSRSRKPKTESDTETAPVRRPPTRSRATPIPEITPETRTTRSEPAKGKSRLPAKPAQTTTRSAIPAEKPGQSSSRKVGTGTRGGTGRTTPKLPPIRNVDGDESDPLDSIGQPEDAPVVRRRTRTATVPKVKQEDTEAVPTRRRAATTSTSRPAAAQMTSRSKPATARKKPTPAAATKAVLDSGSEVGDKENTPSREDEESSQDAPKATRVKRGTTASKSREVEKEVEAPKPRTTRVTPVRKNVDPKMDYRLSLAMIGQNIIIDRCPLSQDAGPVQRRHAVYRDPDRFTPYWSLFMVSLSDRPSELLSISKWLPLHLPSTPSSVLLGADSEFSLFVQIAEAIPVEDVEELLSLLTSNLTILVPELVRAPVDNSSIAASPNHSVLSTALIDPSTVSLENNQSQSMVLTTESADGSIHILNQPTDVTLTPRASMSIFDVTYAWANISTLLTVPGSISTTLPTTNNSIFTVEASVAGVLSSYESQQGITLFVPQDSAFASVNGTLSGLNSTELASVMNGHVLNGTFYSTQLTGTQVSLAAKPLSLSGSTVALQGGNSAKIVTPDILLSNGVAHIVDTVLLLDSREECQWSYVALWFCDRVG
ncbi:hypothetical protein BU15DRAFT_67053 [Melanogaster broomeanus]|nr:hypothetical protein BU15DRAFT_67053 [Melanogaster broomeanus]